MKYVYMNLELGTENADVCDICNSLNDSPKSLNELMSELKRNTLKSELAILRKARLIDLVPTITPEEAEKYVK